MKAGVGLVMIAMAVAMVFAARPRGGEVVAFLASDRAQQLYTMTFVVVLIVGIFLLMGQFVA
jgi:hypothetical protein